MFINWINYQNVLIPNLPPHKVINITKNQAKELIKKYNVYFIRWVSEWDIEKSKFWYIIKDEKESLDNYNSNNRRKIRKALKTYEIKLVSKNTMIDYGYEVYINAFKRYKTFLKPMTLEQFQNSILKSNAEYWGVFFNGKLIAYSQNIIQNNSCNYAVIKLHPDYLKHYPAYGLFYKMNQYYLNEKNFLYVNDGAKSLSHDTNIQKFLIDKFRFRKAYCKLNIDYRKDIELLVNILYPFRHFIFNSNNKILQKLEVLLKHEEIRRSFD